MEAIFTKLYTDSKTFVRLLTCEEGNVMQEAAELWAFARNNSYVAYDTDLIIAAQAIIIKSIGIDLTSPLVKNAGDSKRILRDGLKPRPEGVTSRSKAWQAKHFPLQALKR